MVGTTAAFNTVQFRRPRRPVVAEKSYDLECRNRWGNGQGLSAAQVNILVLVPRKGSRLEAEGPN